MRTLYFTQITDDRFDKNIKELLQKRVKKLKELLSIDGVEVVISDIEEIHFEGEIKHLENGFIYKTEPNNQCRCKFQIRKATRKTTWNDIFEIVNSVKAVLYSFESFESPYIYKK